MSKNDYLQFQASSRPLKNSIVDLAVFWKYRGSLQFTIFGAKGTAVNCKIVKIKEGFNTKTLK